jgi:hypothetical protein
VTQNPCEIALDIVFFFALSHCCRNFISLQLRGCGYDTLPFVIPIKEMTADSGSGFFFFCSCMVSLCSHPGCLNFASLHNTHQICGSDGLITILVVLMDNTCRPSKDQEPP